MGLFRPTGTSRVVVFRVLRSYQSVSVSSTFAYLAVSCLFTAFFLGLRGFPYLLTALILFFSDLASPWPIVFGFPSDCFRFEIQSSLVAFLLIAPHLARCLVSPSHRLGTLS